MADDTGVPEEHYCCYESVILYMLTTIDFTNDALYLITGISTVCLFNHAIGNGNLFSLNFHTHQYPPDSR